MSFLKSLLGSKDPAKRYAREKAIAQSDKATARMKLAKDPDTHKEILYYLAQNDADVLVRRAVAANDSTPVQVNPIILSDKDVDVRLALAERLVRLLPDLPGDKQNQLYVLTIEALEKLAKDEASKVRTALSLTLKDELCAPPEIVGILARDLERQVAEPILRFCAAVLDNDLLDILNRSPAGWTLEAIAGRNKVSSAVADAVIEAYHENAGALLLENKSAEIAPSTLKKIVEKARSFITWQRPLVLRAQLPADAAKALAEFVDNSVRMILMERTDLDATTLDEMEEKFRNRLDLLDKSEKSTLTAEERVALLITDHHLNEEAIAEAVDIRDREFIVVALAALVKTNRANMDTIISMAAPKSIIAVCWKAGLSMRLCLRIQQQIAKVPNKELVYPRGGTDYPLDDADLKWQLDYLRIA